MKALDALISLRSWCRENLLNGDSLIAYDLILALVNNHESSEPLQVKKLLALTSHSYTGIRSHYLRFIDEEWIEIYTDDIDRRVKYVRTTAKFNDLLCRYCEVALSKF